MEISKKRTVIELKECESPTQSPSPKMPKFDVFQLDSAASSDGHHQTQPIDQLKTLVDEIICHKTKEEFPSKCLDVVRTNIVPFLDQAQQDTIILQQHSASGKTLSCILILAASCTLYGVEKLTSARRQFDQKRPRPTRSWISWVRAARKTCDCLKGLRTDRWTSIRPLIVPPPPSLDQYIDNELDDAVVECFINHDLESLPELLRL